MKNGAVIAVEENIHLHVLIAGKRFDELLDLVKLAGRRKA